MANSNNHINDLIQNTTNTNSGTVVGIGLTTTYSSISSHQLSNVASLSSISHLNNYIIPNKPCTSSISSSSKSAIMSSNSQTSAQNLSLTSRDWFSYVYKIENIDDLIKPSSNNNANESTNSSNSNNFVQSPIFSFTNHLVYSNSTNSNMNNINNSSGNSLSLLNNASSSSSSSSNAANFSTINKTIENLGGSSSSSNTNNNNNNNNINTNNLNNNTNSSHSDHHNHQHQNTAANSNNKVKSSNWRLIFYPNGAGADCKNFLSIFLKYLSDEPVKIQMMFSIVDNNNQDIYVKYTVNKFQKSNDWGFKQLIHKNAILYQKEKFLKPYNGGTLSVRVRMRLDEQKNDHIKKLNENLHYCKLLSENFSQYYYNQNCSESNESNDSTVKNSENYLSNQLSQLTDLVHFKTTNLITPTKSSSNEFLASSSNFHDNLNNNLYHDLILLVKSDANNDDDVLIKSNNKRSINNDENTNTSNKKLKTSSDSSVKINNDHFIEIRAHKCILATRSPVFKAMFNYRLKENLTNKLVIEDCKPDVVKAMLKYIYTAQIPDDVIKPIAIDLYIAAEKYFIESLKIKCREYLAENLSSDSVIHTFIVSELYNDSMLRKQSLKFISENIEKVTQNSEWNEFMVAYPQYFTNAFIRLCKKDF